MNDSDRRRLEDILAAAVAIDTYAPQGQMDDGMVFDAVRMRLIEIGEAVKALSPETCAEAREVPWRQIAGMRDHLAHRYFDTAHAVVAGTVREDLPRLRDAVTRLLAGTKGIGEGAQ